MPEHDNEGARQLSSKSQTGRGQLGPDALALVLGQQGQRRETHTSHGPALIRLQNDRAEEHVAHNPTLHHRHERNALRADLAQAVDDGAFGGPAEGEIVEGLKAVGGNGVIDLARIADQVGTSTRMLTTERAASGILRQADAKVASRTRVNPRNGNGNQ